MNEAMESPLHLQLGTTVSKDLKDRANLSWLFQSGEKWFLSPFFVFSQLRTKPGCDDSWGTSYFWIYRRWLDVGDNLANQKARLKRLWLQRLCTYTTQLIFKQMSSNKSSMSSPSQRQPCPLTRSDHEVYNNYVIPKLCTLFCHVQIKKQIKTRKRLKINAFWWCC